MILLTKLDDSKVLVNLEAVKFFESTPDTRVFFINGESLIVKESLEDIERKASDFHKRLLNDS